jgi:hypothetical protein
MSDPMRKILKMVLSASTLVIAWNTALTSRAISQDELDFNQAEHMMSMNVVELKDQLYFGLRTFLPEQRAFIDQVVVRVDSGQLPRAMVNVVFVWARKRNPRVPFPYFEVALKLLAEKRGVIL